MNFQTRNGEAWTELGVVTWLVACVGLALNIKASSSSPILIGILCLAAFYDLKYNRIPNWLNYSGMAVATSYILAYRFWGLSNSTTEISMSSSILGALVCGTLMIVLWNMKLVGGGDVKLVCTIGLFLGVTSGVTTLLITHLFAAVYIIIRKLLDALIKHSDAWSCCSRERKSIPMAGFYSVGTMATLLLSPT